VTKADSQRTFKRPESVLVVIYCAQRVLLLKRADHPDFWQSVTGSLRWDETPPQAARRELAEETGFTAAGLEDREHSFEFSILPRWRGRYAPDVTHNTEYLFALPLSTCAAPRLREAEHRAYLWLPREEALARVWSWSNREGIRRIVQPA
jgi:dATP pyrophosphohydrolase